VIVIQLALLVAVQPQLAAAVTVTVPVAAAGVVRFDAVGAIVRLHGLAAWVTVNVWPATIIVPIRDVAPLFAATL
jgi:hypothetical protein